MAEITSGIRLAADASGVVGGSAQAADALKRVEDQARKTGQAFTEMSQASRASGDAQRIETENLRRAIEAKRAARDAEIALRHETTGLASQLAARARAQAEVNAELERGVSVMRGTTAETLALTAAKSGLRSAMSSLLGLFSGPAGIVSVIAAGAISWASFGNAAEDAGAKATAAAIRLKAAAEVTPRQAAQGSMARYAIEIQQRNAEIRDIEERLGGHGRAAMISGEAADRARARARNLEALNAISVSEIQRIASDWPNPTPSVDDVRGPSPSTAREAYVTKVSGLLAAYGKELGGANSPERNEVLRSELTEQVTVATRQFESQLRSFEGKKAGGGDGESMLIALRNQLSELRDEGSVFDQTMRALTEGTKEYSVATQATALALAGEIDEQRRANEERKTAQKSLADYNRELTQSKVKMFAEVAQMESATKKQQEHAQEIGLTTAQLARLRVARAEEKVALEEQRVALARLPEAMNGELEAAERRLAASRRALDAAREGGATSVAVESAKHAADEWKRASQSIERSLTDALMRGFDKGKTFAENLRDSLVAMFKTLVLEPIIRPIAQAGASAVLGAFGMPGGGGGGGFNPLSLFSSGSNFIDGRQFGILSGGGLFGGGAGLTGSAVSAEIAALTGSGVSIGGALGTGATAGLGAALPWIGGGLLVANALGLFGDDGDKRKPSGVVLKKLGDGRYGIGNQDLPGSEANEPYLHSFTAALSDAAQYDPAILDTFVDRWVMGGQGESAESLVQKLLGSLAPAAQSAQARTAGLQARFARQGSLVGSLQQFADSMATSEYLAPMDRFAGARSLFDETLSAAQGGDAAAALALTGRGSALLSAGRDVYASGPQFAQLMKDVNREIGGVLADSQRQQREIFAEMPLSIRQASQEQIDALERLTKVVSDKLDRLSSDMRAVREVLRD